MMMPMDEVGLGKVLQELRRKSGMTQQDLCHKAGLSYSTLAKIERGAIKSPSIFTVQSIATACGVSLDTLFGVPSLNRNNKKTAQNGVKFVYFDVNGVMVRFFQRAFTKLAEDTFSTPDIIESVFWHYNDAVCRGELSSIDFNRHLAKRLGVESVNWENYYLEAVDPILESQECLRWASEHFNVGLLTNTFPGLIQPMIDCGIIPKIEGLILVDSSVVKAIKPEAKLYEIATEMSGAKPEEILLIDDSRPNLMAAEKHGWHVLWFEYFNPAESIARVKQALIFDEK